MKFGRFLPVLLAAHQAAAQDQDILDVAKDAGLTTLVTALEVSGLDILFEQPFWCSYFPHWCGQYTVFAPTEDAFAALPEGALDRLLSDDFTPHLEDLLKYHVVEGAVASSDINDGDEVAALNAETIEASVDASAITLNGGASVVTADVEASNGVVHVVDEVLLPTSATSNIAEVAVASGLDTLVALLGQVGLDSFVSDATKTLTVFAPTDEAFAELVADGFDVNDGDAVADLLKYHVIEGRVVTQWDLLEDQGDLVTVQGSPISVELEGEWWWHQELKLNGDTGIAAVDVLAQNGIVHVVDKVLMPPAPLTDNIVDVALGNEDFSTLVTALAKAELVDVLQGDGPFTVFAPTNEAFVKAGIVVENLTKEQLTPVLLYHVLAGRVLEGDIASGVVQTNPLDPTNLLVEVDSSWWHNDQIRLNSDVHVTSTDVLATNGVIHVIDNVLLPPKNIVDLAASDPNLSTLVGLLSDAGLDTVLSGDGPFTVFAPSDAAFQRLGDPGLTEEQLTNVLLYHVVSGNVPSFALEKGDVDTLFVQAETPQSVEIKLWWWGPPKVKGDENTKAAKVTAKDVMAANGVVHVIDEVLLPSLS